MKFIDWFAGIGGFRRGMELAGHDCVGFCEFDKFAVASYTSMHLITDEQRKYLGTLDFKKRQKEILKEEYRNGEWYADDIRRVYVGDIPRADCWCFGFPCQDISVNGSHLGFKGNRSSLFFRVMYLIGQLEEEKRPEWLFIENVKNLLSINGGWDFAKLLCSLDEAGYDAEWQVLNSNEFGVPQSRERCFVIGHFRGRGGHQIFPVFGTSQPNPMERIAEIPTEEGVVHRMRSGVWGIDGSVPATTATQSKDPYRLAIPIKQATKQGFAIARDEVDAINLSMPNSNTRRGRVGRDMANTLDTSCNQGILKKADDKDVPKVWYPKENCYIAIRKLTPRECFRLQGWSDDYFEKAQFVNSDNQLYKQAGNGVTVNVIEAIARKF